MIRALLLAVIGAASFAAVYILMPPNGSSIRAPELADGASAIDTDAASLTEVEPVPAADAIAEQGFTFRPGPGIPQAESRAPSPIRDVTPDTMTAGPRVTGALTRVESPLPPARARTERLFNPIVISAGVIKVRAREIHLAGITAPEFDKICGKGAGAWPCGRLARAALRSFIRGRAIECEIPTGADQLPDPMNCLVGGEEISAWLVAQGWAKRLGDAFQEAENKARDAKLGLWGEVRPDVQASTVVRG